jgi:cysteine synthase B
MKISVPYRKAQKGLSMLETSRKNASLLDYIGNTPLIEIKNLTRDLNKQVQIFAKAEWFNPGGSVKDRPALRMIEDAEKSGVLKPGKTIIDSTSGNTGIAYAMIGAVKGYPVELFVPASCSEERKRILKAYGATVNYTDPLEGSDGAIIEAKLKYEADPEKYYKPDQYNNPSNWLAHYEGTGPEIIRQTDGQLTHFIASVGTTGTIVGTGKRLKEFNSNIKVYSLEPDSGFHGIEGLKHLPTSMVPGIYDESFLDGILRVSTEDAYDMTIKLAREDGIFVGQSSGAVMKACLDLASEIDKGIIVTVFPDGGSRYLSTNLWR